MTADTDGPEETLRGLAAQILAGRGDADHLASIEDTDDAFDRELWRELAASGVLAVTVPERFGGLGFGCVGLGLVCEELGRVGAAVPVVATACAAQLIDHAATLDQKQRWLPRIATGDAVVVIAPAQSAADVHLDGSRLTGRLVGVAWAHLADLLLVPVGEAVVGLDPTGPGVTASRGRTTAREVALTLDLDDVPVEPLGAGSNSASWLRLRWLTALSSMQAGVTDAALRMTAAYTSNREQFGRPLSTFQAVALKAADAYLDTTAIRLCARQAAWALDAGHDAVLEVLTAAWWAAEAGQQCVHLTQHLHGGTGADITYPVHRYFLWGKQIELLVGPASALLAEIGDALTDRPDAGDAIVLAPSQDVEHPIGDEVQADQDRDGSDQGRSGADDPLP
jgi:3-oxocholest-4-en-26-oyl-CoA dehydrogenase beta subunit